MAILSSSSTTSDLLWSKLLSLDAIIVLSSVFSFGKFLLHLLLLSDAHAE